MEFGPSVTFPFSNPVLIFATLMALIFLAPQLVTRLKIPGMVGLILGGALAGPSALNLLERDATIVLLGTVGLLYLMFQAGLSLDLGRFNTLKGRSVVFGLISFFLPQLLTLWVALNVLGYSLEASLLLGSIIGSHTLIAYPIVARLGLMKNTAVTMTLGGTLVTDTLSLAILAIVMASLSGDVAAIDWAIFGGAVALYAAAAILGLPRLGYAFFRTVRNSPEMEFGFLMTVLFITAWLAEAVGLAPIIGAFIGGLALNSLVPEQSTLMARIRFNGEALFVPFFLISVGLLIDFRVLFSSLELWKLAAVLVGLVSIGKLAATLIVRQIFGYTWAEGWTIYGLSVPQAAATLAVTLIGFEAGIFDGTLVNAVVVMILATCILGPALVEKYGLEMAHRAEAAPVEQHRVRERLLVPVANPKTSDDLFDLALYMRDPKCREPVYPLMVVTDGQDAEERLQTKRKMLDHFVDKGAEAQVQVRPLARIAMNVANGIARVAREEHASMVLIGWSGHVSTRERIFGTVLDQLLEETRQLLFVNRICEPLATTERVVLAVPPFAERSPGFFEAVHSVKQLASRLDAELMVVCDERYIEQDRELVDSLEPQMDAKYVPVQAWSTLVQTLDEVVDRGAMIFALSARPRSAPWIPELDRLPRVLGERYPDNSLSVVFLSEYGGAG
ncbi:cation:proton antiporter [Bradymonadaceae bacterium TMQ3]|uniref:Cation:proton antiporter n=1 Tax=Lujinxingia sediminis TaxID=2480984 RepID=A0ABY0CQY3_9DELT|nr:cation:proton antiporter [Lujinxingia sediminis]RDV37903.1 cation:proton antiporter [Bradymonadaceae bacterium TMQ3]RVU42767.1 cation:proton antiporter [Lujinxingia sediminis]TXC75318.1 cation:proton antiporter [Bradymonadales bacterium TMQ1]